jgi:hypothetical protein
LPIPGLGRAAANASHKKHALYARTRRSDLRRLTGDIEQYAPDQLFFEEVIHLILSAQRGHILAKDDWRKPFHDDLIKVVPYSLKLESIFSRMHSYAGHDMIPDRSSLRPATIDSFNCSRGSITVEWSRIQVLSTFNDCFSNAFHPLTRVHYVRQFPLIRYLVIIKPLSDPILRNSHLRSLQSFVLA